MAERNTGRIDDREWSQMCGYSLGFHDDAFSRLLNDSFARSLSLPIEEAVRRENVALAELLEHPEKYSWA